MAGQDRDELALEEDLRAEVRRRLAARKPSSASVPPGEVRRVLDEAAARLAGEHPRKSKIVDSVFADLVGLGPLEPLVSEDAVQEILVNGPEEIFVERAGRLERHPGRFRDRAHLDAVLERLVAMAGQTLHELKPFAEGSLPDGSRLHVVAAPMATRGPLISIRRFPDRLLTLEDLTGSCGTLPVAAARFLEEAVRRKTSLLISGAAGTGKTTLLNALAKTIPEEERVVTLESTPELRLGRSNWAALASPVRSSTQEFNTAGLRELVRHALRLRPDRILIGECLGAEAFDLLQAMNTGHSGCMTTIHSHSPQDALERLLTLAMMASVGLSREALGRQAAAQLRLVVQLDRSPDGSRLLTELASIRPGPDGAPMVRRLARRPAGQSGWELTLEESGLAPGAVEPLRELE